tara:strand:- start:894 stop:1268 length:375 start_codon:yes stop_codon:yes gene_type:complete
MWKRKRRRYNNVNKVNEYYSIINKLKSQEKITDDFEIMVSSLTFEELIGLRLELAAKAANHKLYGFKIWESLPNIIKDATLKYVYSASRTKGEAASFLGIAKQKYSNLLKKYNISEYFKKELDD